MRVVVFPEKEFVFVYSFSGAKDLKGNALAPVYKMVIPSVPLFESEVRAAEMAIGLPPEHWTAVQFRRTESVLVTCSFFSHSSIPEVNG